MKMENGWRVINDLADPSKFTSKWWGRHNQGEARQVTRRDPGKTQELEAGKTQEEIIEAEMEGV